MTGGRPILKGWRYAVFVGSIVGSIGLAIYPIIIMPYFNPTPWQNKSKEIRELAGISQDQIQPGDMKIWTDPFDRPGKPGNK